jgi:hypothetical protein
MFEWHRWDRSMSLPGWLQGSDMFGDVQRGVCAFKHQPQGGQDGQTLLFWQRQDHQPLQGVSMAVYGAEHRG